MAVRIVVDGVERYALRNSPVQLEKVLNTRSILRARLRGTIPARLDEVVMYDQDLTTPIFGGIVTRRFVQGVEYGESEYTIDIECSDFLTYADFCFITAAYTVDTAVEDVIDDIVTTKLAAYGITYTPVATGLTLAPFEWNQERVSDALRAISDLTGLVFLISPSKVLTAVVPGSTSAPYAMTDASPHHIELSWSDVADFPVNSIVLLGGAGQRTTSQNFTADGLSYGGVTNYVTDYPAAYEYHGLWPNVIYLDGTPMPVGWEPLTPMVQDGGPFEWVWDPVNHRLRHDDTNFGVTTAGVVIAMTYVIQYPFTVTESSGATPVVELVIAVEDIFTIEQGQQFAQAKLTQFNQQSVDATIISIDQGFDVAQELTVNLTTRGLNNTFIITGITIDIDTEGVWKYNIQASDSDVYRGSYLDRWREMLGGSSAAIQIAAGGGTPSSSVPIAAPVYLGGSRNTSKAPNPAAWTTVVDYLNYVAAASFVGTVRVELWARSSGVGVTARLYNVTDASVVGTSSEVTSQTPVEVTFTVSITAGKTYRLELISDVNGEGVYGIGVLEA